MSGDAVVLSVCWDSDSLFRLASTKLPEERSAPMAIVRLTALGLVRSVTSEDAVADAVKHLHRVYGKRSASMVRRLKRLLRLHFQLVPTPSQDSVRACLPEVLDPADALILAAARDADCFVLLTYNTRHFAKARRIRVFTPRDFVTHAREALWRSFMPRQR